MNQTLSDTLRDCAKDEQALQTLLTLFSNTQTILQQSQVTFQALFDSAPQAHYLLDSNYHILAANRVARAAVRQIWQRDIQFGDSILDYTHPQNTELFIENYQKCLQGDHIRHQRTLPYPNDLQRHYELLYVPIFDTTQRVIGVSFSALDMPDRHQAEADLATILDGAMDAIISLDEQGAIYLYNRAAEEMFGYSATEMIGQTLERLIPSRYWNAHQGHFHEFANGTTTRRYMGQWRTVMGRRANGEEFPIEASISKTKKNGSMTLTVILRDITQRVSIQTALQNRNRELEAMNAMMSAMGSELDTTHVLETLLGSLGEIIEFKSASIGMLDRNFVKILAAKGLPEDFPFSILGFALEINAHLTEALRSQKPIIIPNTHADPRWLEIEGLGYIHSWMGVPLITHGTSIGLLQLDHEIPNFYTEAHADKIMSLARQIAVVIENAQLFEAAQRYTTQLEQNVRLRTAEVERERSQLKTILETMSEGLVYQENHQLVYVNPAFSRLIGFELTDILDNQAEVFRHITAHAPSDPILQGETQLVHKNGHLLDVGISTGQVRHENGDLLGHVTIFRDISKDKALHEQRTRFISNAAHELRNPVNTMMYTTFLLDKDPERLPQNAAALRRAVEHMTQLLDDLLDITRFERGIMHLHLQPHDLGEIVQSIEGMYRETARQKALRFSIHIPPTPVIAAVDTDRLIQVMSNLVMNAINYTPPGGEIILHLFTTPTHALFQVEDTGIGIGPDYLPDTIFEPFSRAHQESQTKGTGLGLAISREIVIHHQGTITVESEVGQGSIFTVSLPLI